MTLRWGILSTARINEAFLAGVAESGTGSVVAVASRDGERAIAYAQSTGIDRAHRGYEALLADDDVDAVYISLPNRPHIEWTRRALEAGKHVLCEKPLSRRAADVADVFAVADRHDRVLMEAFMYRHHPQTVRVAELVAGGAIGRPRVIRSSFSFVLHDPADVRLSRDLDGGALMDLGCYCVSASRLLAGEVEHVTGLELVGGDGVDAAFVGSMRFPHGVLAHFDVGFVVADGHHLEVAGDEGSLFVADPWHCRAPGIEVRRGGATEHIAVPAANSYALQAANFAGAVRGEAPPLLGRADALGQARAIETLYQSAEAGVPIAV